MENDYFFLQKHINPQMGTFVVDQVFWTNILIV